MSDLDPIRRVLSDLVTIDQAARLAHVHPATIRRAFDAGQLDGLRWPALGRLVLRESAERWAEERNTGRRLAA